MAATTPKKPPKTHTFTAADGTPVTHTMQEARPSGNSAALRIGAILVWLVAIALEVVAVVVFKKATAATGTVSTMQWVWIIAALVVDIVCVLIGSLLWKRANHISPASEKNKTLFWLWNNMGVIVSVIAFLPFVLLTLTDKNADAKSKKISGVVAAVGAAILVILALVGGTTDKNPVSQEMLQTANSVYGETTMYWTKGGGVYHPHEDCQHINNTEELIYGTAATAIENGYTRPCKTCMKKDVNAGVITQEQMDQMVAVSEK